MNKCFYAFLYFSIFAYSANPADLAKVENYLNKKYNRTEKTLVVPTSKTELTNSKETCGECNFPGSDFSNTHKLKGVDLSECCLQGSDFSGSDLSKTKFNRALLNGANFNDTTLDDTDFQNANLSEAKFENAYGTNTAFVGATIYNTKFDNVNLKNVNLSGVRNCKYDPHTMSDSQFKSTSNGSKPGEVNCFASFVNADLSGDKPTFINGNFDANYRKDKYSRINNAVLQNADFNNAKLKNVSHLMTDLTNSDLTNADTMGATFGRTIICGTNFNGITDTSGFSKEVINKTQNLGTDNSYPIGCDNQPVYLDQAHTGMSNTKLDLMGTQTNSLNLNKDKMKTQNVATGGLNKNSGKSERLF